MLYILGAWVTFLRQTGLFLSMCVLSITYPFSWRVVFRHPPFFFVPSFVRWSIFPTMFDMMAMWIHQAKSLNLWDDSILAWSQLASQFGYLDVHLHSCIPVKFTQDISGSHIESQWHSRNYPALLDSSVLIMDVISPTWSRLQHKPSGMGS